MRLFIFENRIHISYREKYPLGKFILIVDLKPLFNVLCCLRLYIFRDLLSPKLFGIEDIEDIKNDFEDGFKAAIKPKLVANK